MEIMGIIGGFAGEGGVDLTFNAVPRTSIYMDRTLLSDVASHVYTSPSQCIP